MTPNDYIGGNKQNKEIRSNKTNDEGEYNPNIGNDEFIVENENENTMLAKKGENPPNLGDDEMDCPQPSR